jgi:hypothetical protein
MLRSILRSLPEEYVMRDSGNQWSGSIGLDFIGRLLVVLGFTAPPLVILAVVAYHATHL